MSGDSVTRKSALWMLSNIVLNSKEDLQVVIDSEILMSVAIACRDSIRSVKKEAIGMVGNLLMELSQAREFGLIKKLVRQYELETSLINVLKDDWSSPENQQVALMTYEVLFELPAYETSQAVGFGGRKNEPLARHF